MSPAARSLVLLGDPLQLEQPRKGSHPPGAEASSIGHLLARGPDEPAHLTLPPSLVSSSRLRDACPQGICAYRSQVIYGSRLHALSGLGRQAIAGPAPLTGSGIRWISVEHTGNDIENRL